MRAVESAVALPPRKRHPNDVKRPNWKPTPLPQRYITCCKCHLSGTLVTDGEGNYKHLGC